MPITIIIFDVYILGNDYILGRKGKATCPGGDVITRSSLCKEGCKELNIPFQNKNMKSGQLCYKDGKGKCYQNGLNGAGASLICEKGKMEAWIIFVEIFIRRNITR